MCPAVSSVVGAHPPCEVWAVLLLTGEDGEVHEADPEWTPGG